MMMMIMKKRLIIFLMLFLVFTGFVSADKIRVAANYVEYLLSANYPEAMQLQSYNYTSNEEKLKSVKEAIFYQYGLLKSFLETELRGSDEVTLYTLMENGKLKFDFVLDPTERVITFDYEAVDEIPSAKSTIKITTSPEDSSVYFNDMFQGWSPMTLVKNSGRCKVAIRKNGFKEKVQLLQLSDGDDITLKVNLLPSIISSDMDFKIGNSVLVNSFDRNGWFAADWVSDNVKSVKSQEEHVTQGDKSLRVDFEISEPGEVVVQYPYSIEPRNIKNVETFFMDVYWDQETEALLYLAFQNGENWVWYETEPIRLKQGNNYSVPLNVIIAEDMQEIKVLNVKLYIPTENTAGSVYFDNLRASIRR
jgi:hypothetical protein